MSPCTLGLAELFSIFISFFFFSTGRSNNIFKPSVVLVQISFKILVWE